MTNTTAKIICIFLLNIFHSYGQSNIEQHNIVEEDSLWSLTTHIYKASNDGKWIILNESFGHKESEIILKSTFDTTSFSFPKRNWLMFSDDSQWFGCISDKDELTLMNLVTNSQKRYSNVSSYQFSKTGNYLAAIQNSKKEGLEKNSLLISNLKSNGVVNFENIKEFSWHPYLDVLIVIKDHNSNHSISILNIVDNENIILKNSVANYITQCKWSKSGNAFFFMEHFNNHNTLNYHSSNDKFKILNDSVLSSKYSDFVISNKAGFISDDGKKILFYAKSKSKLKYDNNESMQIWDSKEPWLYPKLRDYEHRENQYRLLAWFPETDSIIAMETDETPTAALNVNHKYGIVYNQLVYEPQYKEFVNSDVYIINQETGEKKLLIKNQYLAPGFMNISPSGKYIAYFNNNHWWVYDINKKQHKNLTKNLGVSFANTNYDRPKDIPPFGSPGWTLNDEKIILYDKFDIWIIEPNGSDYERITNGIEEGIEYRLNNDLKDYLTINIYFSSTVFDFNKDVLLEMSDDAKHKTGLAIWNKKNGLRHLIFEDKRIDSPIKSNDFSTINFRSQNVHSSPSIHSLNLKTNIFRKIYQSNPKLKDVDLIKPVLLNYHWENNLLSGALIYPNNFNPKKKYPMIVFIYEKASYNINIFNPPSNYSYIGFNTLNYILDDYFVFYPDISYKIGEPGMSALNCVTSGVNKVLELGYIDEKRIGLYGHSFGGYESAFIATQTDMFAAIVSGSPATNLTSHYHGVGWNFNRAEIWRYESQQWRMGNSYYNNKEGYLKNSPMNHVENIKKPLLLWSGKEDYQVHWMQSIEMFLALKRLNKTSKLLLFEKEGHFLKNRENQTKLSKEIKKWFDKYCK